MVARYCRKYGATAAFSLTPRFSEVIAERDRTLNRFNGFFKGGKPLKRFLPSCLLASPITPLKRCVNETGRNSTVPVLRLI